LSATAARWWSVRASYTNTAVGMAISPVLQVSVSTG
jgi:hypothetical protein